MDFTQQSYERHEAHYTEQQAAGRDLLARLTQQGSLDHWRHARMYELLRPFLNAGGTWLTVGDGIGTDAHWLEQQGAEVLATDIGDAVLQQAQARGFIRHYRRENAEHMTCADGSFDFVVCKEAYHHFPRPYLALYEMLRAARQAVILIEPQDPVQRMPLLLALKNTLERAAPRLLGRLWKNRYSFEEVGNYVYKVSEREIEKTAMGMGLPAVAFCGLNDYVKPSPKMGEIPPDPRFFSKIKRNLALKNWLCRMGLVPYRLLCCVIFTKMPDEALKAALQKAGYQVVILPKNPFV